MWILLKGGRVWRVWRVILRSIHKIETWNLQRKINSSILKYFTFPYLITIENLPLAISFLFSITLKTYLLIFDCVQLARWGLDICTYKQINSQTHLPTPPTNISSSNTFENWKQRKIYMLLFVFLFWIYREEEGYAYFQTCVFICLFFGWGGLDGNKNIRMQYISHIKRKETGKSDQPALFAFEARFWTIFQWD